MEELSSLLVVGGAAIMSMAIALPISWLLLSGLSKVVLDPSTKGVGRRVSSRL